MRITNNTIATQSLSALQANMAALLKDQAQVSSQHRLTAASDDPSAASQIMLAGSSLRAIDQYKSTVQTATARVTAEDTALQQIGDLVSRAKTLGLAQTGATASAQTRSVANAEIQQIFQQIVAIGNTKVGDEYLFGGQQSTTAPFATTGSGATLAFTSTDPQGQRAMTIGAGQTLAVGHDGKQLLLDSGVLGAVQALSKAFDPASGSYGDGGIATALTSIDSAYSAVQSLVGEVGGQENRLDVTGQNLDAYKTTVTTLKSGIEDVDLEAAITDMASRQTAYQGAMLATSKVMGLTLTDYLK